MKTKQAILIGCILLIALTGIASADSSAVIHLASQDRGVQSSVSFTVPAETTDNFNPVVGQNTVSGHKLRQQPMCRGKSL